jgi:hypothetical protein
MHRLTIVAVLALGVFGGTAHAAYTYVGIGHASYGEWLVTQAGFGTHAPPPGIEQDTLLMGFVSGAGYPPPDYGIDPGASGDDYWQAAWVENR